MKVNRPVKGAASNSDSENASGYGGNTNRDYLWDVLGSPAMYRAAMRYAERAIRENDGVYSTSKHGRMNGDPIVGVTSSGKRMTTSFVKSTLQSIGFAYETTGEKPRDRERMSVGQIVRYLISNVAMTVYRNTDGTALYCFDYDTGIYRPASYVIDDYITALTGATSTKKRADVVSTLCGMSDELVPYIEMEPWRIVVGNGIYNLLTGKLEPFTIARVALSRIGTDYHPDAKDTVPAHCNGLTFWQLCHNFADDDPDRIRLLEEMCTAIVVPSPRNIVFFIVMGTGGDGKSTFFGQMLGTVLGQENVASINFTDIDHDDKLVTAEGSRMILGNDNDDNLYLKNVARIKQLATRERIMLSRKYLSAMPVAMTGISVQLCNTFPSFPSGNAALMRRIVPFHAQHSFVLDGSDDKHIPEDVRRPQFAEHALSCILSLPFRRDFNPVDDELLQDTIDTNDILMQFLAMLGSQTSVLDEDSLVIPMSHLYCAYEDWLEDSGNAGAGTQKLSNRAFTGRIRKYLESYGFRTDEDHKNRRPSAVKTGYDPSLFGDLVEGAHLKDSIAKCSPTTLWFRTEEEARGSTGPKFTKVVPRDDSNCTIYTYLGIDNEVNDEMTDAERREDASWRRSHTVADRDVRKQAEPVDARTWPNASLAVRKRDIGQLERVRDLLDEVAKSGRPITARDAKNVDTVLHQLHGSLAANTTRGIADMVRRIDDAQMPAVAAAEATSSVVGEVIEFFRKHPAEG